MYQDNNFVRIEGRIKADPEVKAGKSGKNYVTFSVAVDRGGRRKEDGTFESFGTDWFNCSAFGGTADYLGKYVKKGDLLALTGSFHENVADGGADGVKSHYWNMTVDTVTVKTRAGANKNNEVNGAQKSAPAKAASAPANAESPVVDDNDELPF